MRLHWRIRFILRKIKHFWQWAPIVWRDEDWDSAYLFEIMRFKIAKMRVDMEKANRHTTVKENVRDMLVVEELLRRHGFSDFYSDNDEGFKAQGLCTCTDEMFDNWLSGCIDHSGKYVSPWCFWCRNPKILRLSSNKENEDFAYLCKVFEKQARRWWN